MTTPAREVKVQPDGGPIRCRAAKTAGASREQAPRAARDIRPARRAHPRERPLSACDRAIGDFAGRQGARAMIEAHSTGGVSYFTSVSTRMCHDKVEAVH
jgi:hypothetical protein